MSNPLEDLLEQLAARRRRDLAARHCADAASRYLAHCAPTETDRPYQRAVHAELELAGAVDEWEAAQAAAPHFLTLRIGRLIISGTHQPAGSPLVDSCHTMVSTMPDEDMPGDHPPGHPIRIDPAGGYAIRMPGGRTSLVVAWIGAKAPMTAAQRRRRRQGGRLVSQTANAGGIADGRSAAAFAHQAAGPRVLP